MRTNSCGGKGVLRPLSTSNPEMVNRPSGTPSKRYAPAASVLVRSESLFDESVMWRRR
ncbi:MAG TPA: hypothetical protein VGQ65_21090 [Thermoanaerobaculia bacterium]|nr:hypothetical protein [Thermoanaerobaculia bacterium]